MLVNLSDTPTKDTYTQLEHAYCFFNGALFKPRLPECVITLNRKKRAYGYFWGETWTTADGQQVTDEIALNPDHFRTRPLRDVLSTLVHEMCHLQQHHHGKPSRNGYHNAEWGRMMKHVGLHPSATGAPGGKETGQKVSHYIIDCGPFDLACKGLIDGGFTIPWQARTSEDTAAAKKSRQSKTKFTCPSCEQNAWAKPHASLVCGECNEIMRPEDQPGDQDA